VHVDDGHAERVTVDSPAAWGRWLEEHHTQRDGAWLVWWKASTGRDPSTPDAYTKEPLRFGWIDSVPRRADDPDRTMLWCSPRRPGSGWSALNKRLLAELEDEGRLEDAGRAAIAAARADGSWALLDEVVQGIVPDDLAAAFAARPGSRQQWDAFPWSARRGMLEWLVTAKREDTRARRIAKITAGASRGVRAIG
jgi:uncharacterized protein YdeI (YjbR/CyaY-like superfamily)